MIRYNLLRPEGLPCSQARRRRTRPANHTAAQTAAMADTSANEGAKGGELLYAGVTRAAIVGVRTAPGVRRGAPAPHPAPTTAQIAAHAQSARLVCIGAGTHAHGRAARCVFFLPARRNEKAPKGVGVLQPRGGRALGAAPQRPDPTHATVTRAACATPAASACGCAARERARRVDGDAHLGALLCVCALTPPSGAREAESAAQAALGKVQMRWAWRGDCARGGKGQRGAARKRAACKSKSVAEFWAGGSLVRPRGRAAASWPRQRAPHRIRAHIPGHGCSDVRTREPLGMGSCARRDIWRRWRGC